MGENGARGKDLFRVRGITRVLQTQFSSLFLIVSCHSFIFYPDSLASSKNDKQTTTIIIGATSGGLVLTLVGVIIAQIIYFKRKPKPGLQLFFVKVNCFEDSHSVYSCPSNR